MGHGYENAEKNSIRHKACNDPRKLSGYGFLDQNQITSCSSPAAGLTWWLEENILETLLRVYSITVGSVLV